jgi:hypothetical protein
MKADKSPRRKPSAPIEVFWVMEGTSEVYSSYVQSRTRNIITFTDGGHNMAKDCFLTPEQALADNERRNMKGGC